ncbi:MAG: HAMP domain-containing histidine kinase [Oscillospiraceae bacterium]|nr:HAMP domain-containing histidine kinase [Oscillospiraceae bacterium]
MGTKKVKIRRRILVAFSAVLFFSFALTGIIFNVTITMFSGRAGLELAGTNAPEGRAGLVLVALVSIMFIVSVVASYFLSNSITKPIEELGKFALNIGKGEFTPNDFNFNELELEDLNKALNKSVQQLAAYDSEQKTFFQNVSHELRTPLMSIKCYAEGISVGLMEPQQASETILQETDRLSELVSDLLYISKIDSIATAYTTEKIDLLKIIRDSIERQQAIAEKRQIRFSYDLDSKAIDYVCSSALITRALDNLISNAIRYAASEIVISCHKKGNYAMICVSDDGKGVDPEDLPHVFERFYKGPNGNHGIGLSIVKSIVEQHNGRVSASNTEGGGAAFTMTLPL